MKSLEFLNRHHSERHDNLISEDFIIMNWVGFTTPCQGAVFQAGFKRITESLDNMPIQTNVIRSETVGPPTL